MLVRTFDELFSIVFLSRNNNKHEIDVVGAINTRPHITYNI